MLGIDLVAGYLLAWVLRRGQHASEQAGTEVDRVVDTRLRRLFELVAGRPDTASALERVVEEAESGRRQPTDRTRASVEAVLEQVAGQDGAFAAVLAEALADVADALAQQRDIGTVQGSTFHGPTAAQFGDHNTMRNTFGS
ncbi:hypothetical protein [Actinacidiphila guanduensis]|uniref:Chromosome partitioning protein n=1 Tax=Actinacidiphila guanduensis TaxID=310781 RepID=A0A1G9UWA2_9ACTN|nr:hypothetical protein [Actinacidiphila guanduensis]SDM63885.1 hypothetical protein SAMN05216259_10111 [Actinacidiphila guanduensis]